MKEKKKKKKEKRRRSRRSRVPSLRLCESRKSRPFYT